MRSEKAEDDLRMALNEAQSLRNDLSAKATMLSDVFQNQEAARADKTMWGLSRP